MVGTPSDGPDDGAVPTIQELVARASDRGVNPSQVAKIAGYSGRQQAYNLRNGKVSAFPKTSNLEPLARALDVDVTTVVLAFAQALGVPVRAHGPKLARLLPGGTNDLSDEQINALVAVIKAMLPKDATVHQFPPAERPLSPPARKAARRPSTPRQRDVDPS